MTGPQAILFDTYVHVWEPTEEKYPYAPPFAPPQTPAGPASRLIDWMDQCGVARAALVQPGNYGYDASMIYDLVQSDTQRFVGLGMVDPTQPDVAERLSYWIEERGMVGMRLSGHWFEAPYMERYWRRAAELQATLSVGPGRIDLAPLVRLLDKMPPTPVVIDHLGHRRADDRPDCQQLLDLARYPHVYVKWSGFYYNSSQPFPHRDIAWFLRATLEAFGAQRLMLAGDFPYVTTPQEYGRLFHQLCREFSFISDEDRAWICGKTADRLWPAPVSK
jgi:L-fuconolactonase